MQGLEPGLQTFMRQTELAITSRADPGSSLATTATGLFADAKTTAPAPLMEPQRCPIHQHLNTAISKVRSDRELAPIAEAFCSFQHRLRWVRRLEPIGVDDEFASGHANAVIIGPDGLGENAMVRIGVSLVAPGITYPDHRHPPAEVYLVLSGGDWRKETQNWVCPGFGGLVYNQPGVIHAMRAKTEPLFAIWCLWLRHQKH
jgi:quercetin dioxygenase-like cupin family protein